ncbi:hypothetical protein BJ508DRAFT_417955 [Ascobolus immersus RN42]|uniref:Uncharacterized protein n=1 Tax=Ascobolus immersus RN42 TaxID=1160509 RepID=A0A3N4HVB4_ASCIM|nr:hypothetical protein BJ508DRAFT_417955 [Ascobolus immersus RN42]
MGLLNLKGTKPDLHTSEPRIEPQTSDSSNISLTETANTTDSTASSIALKDPVCPDASVDASKQKSQDGTESKNENGRTKKRHMVTMDQVGNAVVATVSAIGVALSGGN